MNHLSFRRELIWCFLSVCIGKMLDKEWAASEWGLFKWFLGDFPALQALARISSLPSYENPCILECLFGGKSSCFQECQLKERQSLSRSGNALFLVLLRLIAWETVSDCSEEQGIIYLKWEGTVCTYEQFPKYLCITKVWFVVKTKAFWFSHRLQKDT